MAAFLDSEALNFSTDDEIEGVRSETQSDKDFIDDRSLDSDAEPSKFPLISQFELANWKYRKIRCRYCSKEISASNLKKHKKICLPKRACCAYQTVKPDGEPYYCGVWVSKEEYDKHYNDHFTHECTWCKKRIPYEEYSDHEVQHRLEDLNKETNRSKLKKYQNEYDTNYLVWCKENNRNPKGILLWLQGKLDRKQIDEDLITFAKEELEPKKPEPKKPEPKKTEGPKNNKRKIDDDKENTDVPKGKPEKKKQKKCKSEDDEEDSKKPSQFFQVTIHLKFTWIYTTIIKYILSTFFDGYSIPSRFKKTWPLGCGSTKIFPRPDKWSRMQWAALQKKNALRQRLRARVHALRLKLSQEKFDWEEYSLNHYDYNLNEKRYFRKRFIKPIPLIQEFISGKEYGLGAPLHCHFYIKTKEKMYINTLRRFFRRFKYLGTSLLEHIGTLRSPREWIKYVTKEDHNAIIRNVDKEKCNNNYIMWNFAKLSKNCNISMYSVYRWATTGQMNKYRDIHAAYWEPIIKREAYEKAMQLLDPTEKDDIELIADFLLRMGKKGIYLYGEPKTGKSTTALAVSKGSHYQVPEGNSTFAFHSWKNEPYILFEDISDADFLHFRNKVNQLCDEHGLCFAQTKGGGSKLITCEKVIVTSNYDPPSEETWPGFERRFFCLKYSRNRVTSEQINHSQLYNIFY